jgi:SPP1 gp7 family putative phage head morphogenesis protein
VAKRPTKTAEPKSLFTIPRRVEANYAFEIADMLARFFRIPEHLDLEAMGTRLMDIAGADDFTNGWAEKIAGNMVNTVSRQNERGWRAAASEWSQGRRIFELLRVEQRGPVGVATRNLVAQNALLIKSIPVEVALQANSYIQTQQMRGRRAADIAKDLRERLPDLKRTKVDLIARTEVAKAATAMTHARSMALNIRWYQWLTSEDIRVRKSHAKMDLVLVAWADPPSPEALVGLRSTLGRYHAGNCPNCRCDPAPVVDLSEIQWPAKVYTGGKIVRMSRRNFEAIAGVAA